MDYQQFLESKQKRVIESGFDIEESELNPMLFDFQKYIIRRALKVGRFAIFADTGLGKTFMQLEWAKFITKHTKLPVLVLCPLAVSGQTINEGKKLGINIVKFNLQHDETTGQISNYEQLDNIDCSLYGGVILDESSILKNYNGATKTLILEKFKNTPFKLACTATPSPNDDLELGNHSEFLNVV